jgi:O-antigen ligase
MNVIFFALIVFTSLWLVNSFGKQLVFFAILAPYSNELAIGGVKVFYVQGLIFLLSFLINLKQNKVIIIPKWLSILFVVWAIFVVVAFVLGGSNDFTDLSSYFGSLVVAYLVISIKFEENVIERFLKYYSFSFVAIACFILVSKFFFYDLQSIFFEKSSQGLRMTGFFLNPNTFASALIPAVVYLFYALISRPNLIRLALFGIISLAMFLAQSRAALLGTFIGIALTIGFLSMLGRLKLKRLSLIVLPVVTATALSFAIMPKEFLGIRLERVANERTGVFEISTGEFAEDRFYIFETALKVVADNPFGLGFSHDGSHKDYMNRYGGVNKNPHNFLLKELLNFGIIGGAFIFLFYFTPILTFLVERDHSNLSIVFFSIFVSFYLFNLAHSTVNWIYLYVFWGLAVKEQILSSINPNFKSEV